MPPSHAVLDEQGGRHDLRALAAGAPALLVPVFTRCSGTCPVTASVLRQALATEALQFRVIVLSFDVRDQPRDLRELRRRLDLPRDWMVVRSEDAASARSLLDGLDFHVMTSGPGFDHPNQVFAFSPGGRWAATLSGSDFTVGDLRAARARAMAADDPATAGRLGAWLIRPEAWILLACVGLVAALIGVAIGRGRSRAPGATK